MVGKESADASPDKRVRVGNQNADQSSLKGEPCAVPIRYMMTRNERKRRMSGFPDTPQAQTPTQSIADNV